MTTDTITILLVDDHPAVRSGVRQELEQEADLVVVADAGSMDEAVMLAQQHHPQVAVIDVQLADGCGIEACRRIVTCCPETRVLMLTAFDWDVYLYRSREAGAAGFRPKTSDLDELTRVIRAIAGGRTVFTEAQLRRIQTWQQDVQLRLDTLTPREWEVLRLVVAGKENRDIAEALVISESTVAKHVSALLSKLNVPSRQALMVFVIEHHIEV